MSSMNVNIKPNDFHKVLDKYNEFKEILRAVETGTWKDNPKIGNIPVEKLEHIRYIVAELDKTGFGQFAETRKESIN